MKKIVVMAVAGLVCFGMVFAVSSTGFAAESTASYGYLVGQQAHADLSAKYKETAGFSADEEREAFFEKNGIGEGSAYSTSQHIDAEALVMAGVIDQETADKIVAYAAEKHQSIQKRYEGLGDMSLEERHTFFEGVKSDGSDGDSVDELLNEEVITEEQAAAIEEYLSE